MSDDATINPIREWREHNAMTRKEFAEPLKVSWQTVKAWETRVCFPGPRARRELAKLIKVEVWQLYQALKNNTSLLETEK